MGTNSNRGGNPQNNYGEKNNMGEKKADFLENASRKHPRGKPINEVLSQNPSLRDKRLFGLRQYFEKKKAAQDNPEKELLKAFESEYGLLPDESSDKVRRRYLMLRQIWLRLQQMKRENKSADTMARQEIRLFRFHEAYAMAKDKFLKSSDDDQLKKVREIVEDYERHPEKAEMMRSYIESIMTDPSHPIPAGLEHMFLRIERGSLKDIKLFDRSENKEQEWGLKRE